MAKRDDVGAPLLLTKDQLLKQSSRRLVVIPARLPLVEGDLEFRAVADRKADGLSPRK